MARNQQLIRQLKLLQMLGESRYGMSLEEMNRRLVEALGLSGLSERTVRRDLDALEAAGFEMHTDTTPRGRVWRLAGGRKWLFG